ITAVCVQPASGSLLVGRRDGTVHLHEAAAVGSAPQTLRVADGREIQGLDANAQGGVLAVVGSNGELVVSTSADAWQTVSLPSQLKTAVWIGDRQFATLDAAGTLAVWSWDAAQPDTPLQTVSLPAPLDQSASAIARIDNQRMAVALRGGPLVIANLESNQIEKQLSSSSTLQAIVASPDGARLLGLGEDHVARTWQLEGSDQQRALSGDFRLKQRAAQAQLTHQLAQRQVQNAENDVKTVNERLDQEKKNLEKVVAELDAAQKKLAEQKEAFAKADMERTTAQSAVAEAESAVTMLQQKT